MAGKGRSRRTSSRRRSAKTGRFASASAPTASAPRAGLAGTLLLRKELLHDFVLYLDAGSLVALCNAMNKVSSTSAVLLDTPWWRELLQSHCHMGLEGVNVHRSVTQSAQPTRVFRTMRPRREGRLGAITTVGDQQVDCLVFPTSSSYRNPGRGVAGRVHERAGPDLDRAVVNLNLRNYAKVGDVMCTVGCDSGMRRLVHCVGPTRGMSSSEKLLYKTYVNAFLALDSNDVQCAAVASISTGLYRFPVPRAADIALSAIRDLIRLRPRWNARVAFVCIDDDVYEQFQRAHRETFQAFHTTGFAYPSLVETLSMAEPRTGPES
ncbi:Macro domain [Phytophthora cactorum]|nr:Macro domain [Phytophthora cactorum]